MLVEADPNFRAALEALFSEESGFFVAARFPSAVAFMHSAEEIVERGADHWDLVLMDIEMPGMSGIEATSRLKRWMPQVPVVVVTVFEEPATILDAICAGADGYLLKKTPVPELLAQLRSIASGGSPLTPGVARSLLDLVRRGAEKPHRRHPAPTRLDLSEREQEVLRCLTRGLSYKRQLGARGGLRRRLGGGAAARPARRGRPAHVLAGLLCLAAALVSIVASVVTGLALIAR